MPRKSRNDINIIPLPGRRVPEPPDGLSAGEAAVWRRLAASLPDEFLDEGSRLLLRRAVSTAMVAERHEQRLRQLAASDGVELEVELEIERAHIAAGRSLTYLLNALRLTPRSRERSRNARTRFETVPRGPRPWDIKAKAVRSASEPVPGDDEAS